MSHGNTGNEFWKARSSHGRKPAFETPESFIEGCLEYFQWVEENPLLEHRVFCSQGEVTEVQVPKMRAMTKTAACLFLDITPRTWELYRKREGFEEAVEWADNVIRTQKFEGAAADFLNPNIILRDLGLADKTEITGKDGGSIKTEDVSDRDLARRIAYLLSNATKDS